MSTSATLDEMKRYNVQWLTVWSWGTHSSMLGRAQTGRNRLPRRCHLCARGYDRRNTGVYLTGLQQLGDFTLEAAARGDDNSQFGRHGTWQTSARMGVYRRLSLCLLGTSYKESAWWANCMVITVIRT
ncbi:hypothetical protein KCP74_03770 [Salmonella enterica subsp. enterica]|nr:hypothetical protein KCP74_03770 [Salmonella enterica subsp. enterica]